MEKYYFGRGVLPNFYNELIDRCFGNPLSEDPDTTEWGFAEAGYGWFNTAEGLPKYWDGTQIVALRTIQPYDFLFLKVGSTYHAIKGSTGQSLYQDESIKKVVDLALIDLGLTGGTLQFLNQIYEDSDTIITINSDIITVQGMGSDRKQEYFTDPPTPLERLTKGTIFRVTGADKDAIKIVGKRFGIVLKHFAIDFTNADTGHGINCIADTNDRSVIEFYFEDIFVNDHDADHYALKMQNPSQGMLQQFTSFGGALLEIEGLTMAPKYGVDFHCGNIVFSQMTGWVTKDLTVHAVNIHRTSGVGVQNLMLFDRLFVIGHTGIDWGASGINKCALYIHYGHHSQFNMLNLECEYTSLGDIVHITNTHDITFFNPYIGYSANAHWYVHTDADTIRCFGGSIDVEIDDRSRKDLYEGVCFHSVNASNEATLKDCHVWTGSEWKPTNAYGSAQGTSPLTVPHGMITTPSWISAGPCANAGDWYFDNVDATSFQIVWAGGGTVFWYWNAGCHQNRP